MESIEARAIQEAERPQFLYHGSPNGAIEEFEPRVSKGSGEKYGPLVYATPEIEMASIMMAKGGLRSAGKFSDIPFALIVQDREEFIAKDQGGYIYVLPVETFSSDPERGWGNTEWGSKERVKPIDKFHYPSALDAMLTYGVQVYFINDAVYQQIRESPDHGLSTLQKLESENQRREINVKLLKMKAE